jgi:hypothetical protein
MPEEQVKTPEEPVKMRGWIRWTIIAVWVITAAVVLVLTQLQLPVTSSISVRTREISLGVNPALLLSASEESQISISGPAKFALVTSGPNGAQTLDVDAHTAASSCTFYLVHTDSLSLVDVPAGSSGEERITLLWPENADESTFAVRMSQHVAGTLAAAHGAGGHSSFVCSGVTSSVAGEDTLSGNLADDDGSSFRTRGASQIIEHQIPGSPLESTNLHVADKVWVAHFDTLPAKHAIATLLKPLPNRKNQVLFDGLGKNVEFNVADIIEVTPGDHFDIRSVIAKNGIQIELHGTVKDLRVGAGSDDLVSCMPSIFDLLDAKKRIIGVIPGIVATIIGILESLGFLPRREKK